MERKEKRTAKLASEYSDEEAVSACADYTTRSEVYKCDKQLYACMEYRRLWNRASWIRDRNSERGRSFTDEAIVARSKDPEFRGAGRNAFARAEPGMYHAAYVRGILESLTWLDDERGRTNTQVLEESKRYATRQQIERGDPQLAKVIRRRRLFESMPWLRDESDPEFARNLEAERERRVACVVEKSKAYRTVVEFGVKDPESFALAESLGLLKGMDWLEDDRS